MNVGIDYGRPGGDQTAFAMRCEKCGLTYVMTCEPSRILVVPIGLDCPCGHYTDARADHPTSK